MAAKGRYLTDAQLTVVGRRYGSDAVALEANEALARWRRDVGALAEYGFGQSVLDAFAADVAQHTSLRSARPDAVADKRSAVVARVRIPEDLGARSGVIWAAIPEDLGALGEQRRLGPDRSEATS